MTTNIIFPTDFSDTAWNAVVYALKLFTEVHCKFYFLHSTAQNSSRTSKSCLEELTDLKDMAENSDANANHNFEIILSKAPLEDALNRAIENYCADFIIMGTKGANTTTRKLFGSLTQKMINAIDQCPILVIPEDFEFESPLQIAFPTDFNRVYGAELKPLIQLAEIHNSKIRIVHINTEEQLSPQQEHHLSLLEHQLLNYPCSFHWMPDYASKTEEINSFIETLGIQILVLFKNEHSMLSKLTREPVVTKIGERPVVPVLIIKHLK